jgi:hypothetical protein
MGSLILTSEKEIDLKLLKMLAEKLGISAHEISDDDKEDIGLYLAMIEGKKEDYVREEEVLKELRK